MHQLILGSKVKSLTKFFIKGKVKHDWFVNDC